MSPILYGFHKTYRNKPEKNHDTVSCSYSKLSRLNTKKREKYALSEQAHNTGLKNVFEGGGVGGHLKNRDEPKNK